MDKLGSITYAAGMVIPTHQRIIDMAEVEFGVEPGSIVGRSRTNAVCMARFCFCYVIKHRFLLSTPETGRILGRDHATVMAALLRAEQLLIEDDIFHHAAMRVLDATNPGLRLSAARRMALNEDAGRSKRMVKRKKRKGETV